MWREGQDLCNLMPPSPLFLPTSVTQKLMKASAETLTGGGVRGEVPGEENQEWKLQLLTKGHGERGMMHFV